MAILHKSKGGVMPPAQSSSKMDANVGSGSRPTKSKFMIETSAPADPRGLGGRKTPGALGG